MPEKAIVAVQDCLNGTERVKPVQIELQGKKINFRLNALKKQKTIEGCIMLVEV